MNLMAKLKAMQREIEALRAQIDERLQAMQRPQDPWPGAVQIEAESLSAPIKVAPTIASATIAPPPKKRGRPPKAT